MKTLHMVIMLFGLGLAGCAQRSPVSSNHVSRMEAIGIVTRFQDPQEAEGRVPFDSVVAESNYYIESGAARDRSSNKDKR